MKLVVSKLIGLIIIAYAIDGFYLRLFKNKPAHHPEAKITDVVALYSTVLHIFYCSGSDFPITSYGEEIILAILWVFYYNRIVIRTICILSIHLFFANMLMSELLLIESLRVSFILIFLLGKGYIILTTICVKRGYDDERDKKFYIIWLMISLARIFTSLQEADDTTLVEVHTMNAINNFFFFWYV